MATVLQPAAAKCLVWIVIGISSTFAMLALAFWLWMLTDCIRNELPGSRKKLAWIVFIAVFGLFGAFCYNAGRRKTRIRELGR
jgi:drug/metabolite transporter (DMT)-like permease